VKRAEHGAVSGEVRKNESVNMDSSGYVHPARRTGRKSTIWGPGVEELRGNQLDKMPLREKSRVFPGSLATKNRIIIDMMKLIIRESD
jgi:hypothetical protein